MAPSVVAGKFAQYSIRISVALALAAMLVAAGPGRVLGYSCVSVFCYGTSAWSSSTEYFGAYTDISVVNFGCDPTCVPDGALSNEMWLIQETGCTDQTRVRCWVETGYIDHQSSEETLFWADRRPGQPFMFNMMVDVPASDYGHTDHFMIVKDGRTSPNPFLIFMYNDSLSTLFEGTSNDNSMTGREIRLGQELHGTVGASAQPANFTRNIFAVQALGPDYVFWYNVQTTKGFVRNDTPPAGQWNIDPATSGSSPEGGEFSTNCC